MCVYIFRHNMRDTIIQKSIDLLENCICKERNSESLHLFNYWNSLIKFVQTYDMFVEIGKKMCNGQTEKGLTILTGQTDVPNCGYSRDKTKPDTSSVKLTKYSDLPPEICILRNLPDGRPNKVVQSSNVYLCMPVFQGMENPNQRLQTYSHWPTKTKQWPLQLSNAGFYFTGTGTEVKCATCGVETEVESWSSEKPEVVHYKLNNKCDFLQANFPNLPRKNNHERSNAAGVCNHKTENAVSTNNHLADQNTVTAKRNPVQPEPTKPCLDNKSATFTRTSDHQSTTALQHRVKQSLTGTRTHDSRSNLQTSDQQSMTVLRNHVKQPATVASNNDQHTLNASHNGVQQSAIPTPNHEQQLTTVNNHIQQSMTNTRIHDQLSMNDNIVAGTITSGQDITPLPTQLTLNNHLEPASLQSSNNYGIVDDTEQSLTTTQNNTRDRPLHRQESLDYYPLIQSKSGTSYSYEISTRWTIPYDENNTTRSYPDNSDRPIHENYHPNIKRNFPSIYNNATSQRSENSNQNMSPLYNNRDGLSFGSSIYMDLPSSPSVNNREYEPVFSHPQYRQLDQRLLTFRNWTKNHIQPIETLAECGMFYIGEDDIVRCFCCNLGLSEWATEDNPWTEHAKHQPKCWFLRKQKGQEFIDNVQEKWKKQYSPKNAAFDDYNSRLATFAGWREDISQTAETLAEAGFFFTGEEDIVRCHYCDGGLRNWEPNDIPWEEHARWFSSCKYLTKMKGVRYIRTIQEKYQNCSNATNTENQVTSTTENTLSETESLRSALRMGFSLNEVNTAVNKYIQTQGNRDFTANDLANTIIETLSSSTQNEASLIQSRPVRKDNDINSLRAINSDLKAKRLCVLCKQNESIMLFTNCGHRVTCELCCISIDFCPICDKRIKKRIKTFLS